MDWQHLAKILILIGACFVAIGVFLLLIKQVPFLGRLPGDILIQKKSVTIYFPLASCLLISLILSLILFFLSRR